MSEGYDTSGLFDDIPMTNATRMELNHRVRMHVLASNTLIEEQAARIAELERVLTFEATQSAIEHEKSEARLSEAVKVLEPIVAVLTASEEYSRSRGKDIDAVSENHEVTSFSAAPNLKLGHLRAAKAFLATLGGKNEA